MGKASPIDRKNDWLYLPPYCEKFCFYVITSYSIHYTKLYESGINVRGFNHVLGECGISFLAVPQLARPLRKDFPRSLNGAPMLIPSETNLVRSKLLEWLDSLHIYPRIVGEFDDSALMKVFGQAGKGISYNFV